MSPKAGLFAGEVTPQAPSDDSPTSKDKGYWWMEYGTVVSGLCGDGNDLSQGQLLNVTPVPLVTRSDARIVENDPLGNGVSFADSTVFSFTVALLRGTTPDAGFYVYVLDIFNVTNTSSSLAFRLDSNGFMNLQGRNQAGTIILDAQITNDGGSFADSELHFFSMVIDLTDVEKREVLHNSVNITESSWITWNTYTNDLFQFEDLGGAPALITYNFGGQGAQARNWGEFGPQYNGTSGVDSCGYVTFDNSCTLIASSVWDSQGFVRDPQAWEGWYKSQPQVCYLPSFWKNTGKTAPVTYKANDMELNMDHYYHDLPQTEKALINIDAAGIILAIGN